jgi:hypothetical protein
MVKKSTLVEVLEVLSDNMEVQYKIIDNYILFFRAHAIASSVIPIAI